jgi:hypothetical protein
MSDDKYWPRSFVLDDPGPEPVSLLNEPIREDVAIVPPKQRPLHAMVAQGLGGYGEFDCKVGGVAAVLRLELE